MRNPDPLIMSADIARLASERPELGEELVRAMYQHLVLIEARQPDDRRAAGRTWTACPASSEQALRQRLGLAARRGRAARQPAKPARGARGAPAC